MAKKAAQIAKDLSDHDSKNRQTGVVATEADEVGGIQEPVVEPEPEMPVADPFSLVPGRPNIDYWGPYPQYMWVTTPSGEYAVPYGKLLRLEQRMVFDKKEGMEVMRTFPMYEDAPAELVEYVNAG